VSHRVGLSGVERVRFAPGRGLALIHTEPTRLVLMDLRFGQVLKEHREERPVLDAAIDPAGQVFAVRFSASHEDVSVGTIRDMLAAPRERAEVAVGVVGAVGEVVGEAGEAGVVGDAADAIPAARPFFDGDVALVASPMLSPRAPVPTPDPDAAAALLERYREVIAALAAAAIARAWDEGRLSAPVEGGLPFYAEVAGLRRRAGGRAAAEVAEATLEVEDAFEAVRAHEAAFGDTPPPLAALTQEFGLSAAAQLILIVVAVPTLWGELARLYGILSNDIGRPLVDELLVTQILEHTVPAHLIAAELDRAAPLVRFGLVHPGAGSRPFVRLSCDPIVLRLLRGADPTPELKGIRVVEGYRPFARLLIGSTIKDDVARRLAAAPASAAGRLVITGRSGAGRHATLAAIGAAAGRGLAIIDATMILRDLRKRGDELVALLRRANLVGLLPCVDGLEAIPSDDPSARDLVRELLDEHPGPLAIRLPHDVEPPLAPGYVAIELPPLTMTQRVAAWRVMLDEHGLFVRDPDDLVDRYRVGPGVIATVCAKVAARASATGAGAPATALAAAEPAEPAEPADAALALEVEIRQHLDTKLRATASRVTRLATWAQVILPPDIQESVLELIARIRHRRTVYDTWGMGDVLTTARGVTALFQGGPGTGKTLVASAIANELGMDLYRVDLSRIMSKWIGETEQNLAKLFDAAEDGHTIVLFDEADSLFAKRTEVKSSVDRYANLEVNYLLQRLDSFEGIAILTTNFGTSIDNAFKRRLSFRLTFPFPDDDAREALWRTHLPAKLPQAGDFDLAGLARRYQLSGGYIRNATLRAAFLAAEEQSPLTQDHLERAIKAEFREIGKIAQSGVLE
jgi:hypothetical protein